jgi:hypothetical protein
MLRNTSQGREKARVILSRDKDLAREYFACRIERS